MKSYKIKQLSLALFAIVWTFTVIIGYYLTHKPVTPTQVLAIMQSVLDIAIAIGFTGLAGALGRRLLPARVLSSLERFVVQATLGMGILAFVWLCVGFLGLYRVWVAWLFLILGLAILWRYLFDWLKELQSLKRLWIRSGYLGKTLAVGISVMVLIQLMYALAPPVKWDALMYHLELPRRYLAAGRFLFQTSNPYWWFPQITEMLYTWSMALRGWETATVVGCFFSVILLIGILGLVARNINATAAWVSAAALMVGYTFRYMFSWGYVDEISALFGLCVLIGILEFVGSRQREWIYWIGIFTGFALGVKLTNGLMLLILLTVFILLRKEIGSRWWGYLLMIYIISAMLFLPWLLKNEFFSGFPAGPLSWFPEWLDIARIKYSGLEGPIEPLQWHDVLLPLSMTWFGIEGGLIAGLNRYQADIGPLLVLFMVPGLIDQRRNKRALIVIIWLLTGLLAMLFLGRINQLFWQTRIYYCLLPAIALAVGWGWRALDKISVGMVRIRRIAGSVVLLVMILVLWGDTNQLMRTNPIGTVLGVSSENQYLDEVLGWYAPVTRALYELPNGSRTFFLWEARGLYAPINTQTDGLIDNWYLARRKFGEEEKILEHWKNEEYTHLLVYLEGAEFEHEHRAALSGQDWQAINDLLGQLPPPVNFGGVYELYSLIP